MKHLYTNVYSRGQLHSFSSLPHDGPQPVPNPVLHRVRSTASSYNLRYLLVSLRSSRPCLRLLPRLSLTFVLLCVFPSERDSEGNYYAWAGQSSQVPFFLFHVGYVFLLDLLISSFCTWSVQQRRKCILLLHYCNSLIGYLYQIRALWSGEDCHPLLWVNDQIDAQLRYNNTFIIIILYMFRATLCSSSGGQIVLIQHLV